MSATSPSLERRPLGRTGLRVTPVCVGTSPLASMESLYGYAVGEDRAVATVEAALRSPINLIDTSNGYGEHGESEVRIGRAIHNLGGLPPGYVLSTKVDPAPGSSDFSGARVRASLAESMERLGLVHIDLLHLHDPERISVAEGTASGGPLEALVALRDEGLVDHLGVAGGDIAVMQQYVDTGAFDVVLNHNRYTLLDRSAQRLYQAARARGMGVLNAAPYGGGMLVKGPDAQPKYAYHERGGAVRERVLAMKAACDRHGVPLAAAALQFSTRDPLVDSTVVGVSSPERIDQTLGLLAVEIPADLWEELATLAPPPEEWLDPEGAA